MLILNVLIEDDIRYVCLTLEFTIHNKKLNFSFLAALPSQKLP